VLVAALESAPAAIFYLSVGVSDPVWANARARAMGTARDALPVVDGRPVGDLVDGVLRTGQAETVHGAVGGEGGTATVVVRPMSVEGRAGALLVLEAEGPATDPPVSPHPAADVVEQAQLSLLCFPTSVCRAATTVRPRSTPPAATGTTPCRSAGGGWRWSWVTRSGTACPRRAR
jgi:hypothetical protein